MWIHRMRIFSESDPVSPRSYGGEMTRKASRLAKEVYERLEAKSAASGK